MIATTSYDNTVRLWDASTGTPLVTFTGHKDYPFVAAFSPDGTLLATRDENAVLLWRLTPNDPVSLMEEARERVSTAFTDEECAIYFGDDPESCPQTLEELFP